MLLPLSRRRHACQEQLVNYLLATVTLSLVLLINSYECDSSLHHSSSSNTITTVDDSSSGSESGSGNGSGLSRHWLMKMSTNDLEVARRVAREHNFTVIRRVGTSDGYFVIEYDVVDDQAHKIHKREALEVVMRDIVAHPLIESVEKEKLLVRRKRDFVELPVQTAIQRVLLDADVQRQQRLAQVASEQAPSQYHNGIDPFWPEMWYLNRHMYDKQVPDMNVSGAWAQGFSGRGVSVTFLDDGLEWNHPDIMQNYDPKASTDINSNDEDPMPRYDDSNENKHGTRCAGEVAAVANNSVCSVGVAFNSGIGGIRMLDGDVTDSVEASSLGFNADHIHIYSASWGPDDNGEVVDGPGALARKAFFDGINRGRQGLGSIYVWASGNGGRFNDSCACDGYANSIYTFSISSTSERGEKPWYLEECASTLATTYSSGDERNGEKEIITTDIRHKCTTKHTGTSAAAPIAAGIIALALEANPRMTWRDVMFTIVLTSRADAIKSNNYITNKRGFKVSPRYGFGLMDAGSMVSVAKTWINVPPMASCATYNSKFRVESVQKANSMETVLNTDACANTINEVNFIEQVEVIVTIKAPIRGQLEVYLTSPMGTRSQILPKRSRDASPDGFKRWPFMSVHFWGEIPRGDWRLTVTSADGTLVQVEDYSLVIHGTRDKPLDYERFVKVDISNCHFECEGDPCGPTEYDCQICSHFSLNEPTSTTKRKCVSYCPVGYYADYALKTCVQCDKDCRECNGSNKSNCTSCAPNLFLKRGDTNECVGECPIGYFINTQNQCEKCDSNCVECRYERSHCLKCRDDLSYDYDEKILALKANKCVFVSKSSECPSASFFDFAFNACDMCDLTCAECDAKSELACLACGGDVRRPYLKAGQCVSECGEGFFLASALKKCLRCDESCERCANDSGECIKCKPTYSLSTTTTSRCEQSLFYDNQCGDKKNCYECFGTGENECLICKNGFVNLNGRCLKNAPLGYYVKEKETSKGNVYNIEECEAGCEKCTKDECVSCKNGYRLVSGICHLDCDLEHYPSGDGKCEKCKGDCKTCLNETYCLSCVSNNLYFLNGKCLDKCPTNYFPNHNFCEECHYSCESCKGPGVKNCLTCSLGYKRPSEDSSECKSDCPDSTYFDPLTYECRLCNTSNCHWCIKTANTCTKCPSPLALDKATSQCKPCCARLLRGSLKNPSCCNCPLDQSDFDGICLSANSLTPNLFYQQQPSDPQQQQQHSKTTFIVSVVFFCFSVFVFLFSVYFLLKSLKKRPWKIITATMNNHHNVKYSVLQEITDNNKRVNEDD